VLLFEHSIKNHIILQPTQQLSMKTERKLLKTLKVTNVDDNNCIYHFKVYNLSKEGSEKGGLEVSKRYYKSKEKRRTSEIKQLTDNLIIRQIALGGTSIEINNKRLNCYALYGIHPQQTMFVYTVDLKTFATKSVELFPEKEALDCITILNSGDYIILPLLCKNIIMKNSV